MRGIVCRREGGERKEKASEGRKKGALGHKQNPSIHHLLTNEQYQQIKLQMFTFVSAFSPAN